MRYLPTEKCKVSLRRPSEREECPQRRVLPPSVVGEKRIEEDQPSSPHRNRGLTGGDCAITESRMGRVHPRLLSPAFAKGAFFFSSQVMMAITNQIDIPRGVSSWMGLKGAWSRQRGDREREVKRLKLFPGQED